MLTFATEAWADCLPEIERHWATHWDEVAVHKAQMPLAPDYARYERLADAGMLHVTVARSEGQCVGYVTAIVDHALHYATTLTAQWDLYYLAPERRRGRASLRLFEAAEKALRRRGVQRMITGTKLSKDQSRLLEHLGWIEIERTFSKWIGD